MRLIKAARGRITTNHGEDIGRGFPHVGIDIGHGNMTGDDRRIVAPAAGRVTAAGWLGTYGNRLVITHDDGTWSLLAHIEQFHVGYWDRVEQGQDVALMGSTGGNWAVHCHQEYHLANGRAVDPVPYFAAPADSAGPLTPIDEGDSDMQVIRNKETGLIALVGPEVFAWMPTMHAAEINAAVHTTKDEIHDLSAGDFYSVTQSLGIPNDRVAEGVFWSRGRASHDVLVQIMAKLEAASPAVARE